MRIAMHCLQWTHQRRIGSEVYLEQLGLALIKQGHEVFVYARDVNESLTVDGIHVNTHSEYFDLVITQAGETGFARVTAQQHSAPLVCIVHSLGESELATAKAGNFDLVIANSENTKKAIGHTLNPVRVLVPPAPTPKRVKTRGQAVTLIGSSIFKGVNFASDAARYLPQLDFLTVRGGYGGGWLFQAPNWTELEHQQSLDKVWKKTGVLLMLSLSESWGMVCAEALAHGIPTIYWDDLRGVAENIGDTGTPIPRGDLEELILTLEEGVFTSVSDCLTQAKTNRSTYTNQLSTLIEYFERIAS